MHFLSSEALTTMLSWRSVLLTRRCSFLQPAIRAKIWGHIFGIFGFLHVLTWNHDSTVIQPHCHSIPVVWTTTSHSSKYTLFSAGIIRQIGFVIIVNQFRWNVTCSWPFDVSSVMDMFCVEILFNLLSVNSFCILSHSSLIDSYLFWIIPIIRLLNAIIPEIACSVYSFSQKTFWFIWLTSGSHLILLLPAWWH